MREVEAREGSRDKGESEGGDKGGRVRQGKKLFPGVERMEEVRLRHTDSISCSTARVGPHT